MQVWQAKIAIFVQFLASSRVVNAATENTVPPDRGKLVTLIAGSKWRRFFARDDDEVFVTRSLNFTPKAIEQHLITQ